MVQQRIPIERIVLGVIAVSGMMALLAVAPGLGLILKRFGVEKRLKGRTYISNVLYRLERKGFIEFEGTGQGRRVRVTTRGREYLEAKRLTLFHRPKTRPWDGYWRIIVFDIPEKLKKVRDLLRKELAEVGFKKLQASVWVSPDECEEYIKLLKADRRIGKFLIYLKTKDIEYGTALAKLFKIEKRTH
jgi:DNA-binding transcriptional regulator PaaX